MLHIDSNYKKNIDWLFNQFPAYQKIGILAYKPDLDNVLSICKQLNIEYNQLKYIHVAGTNGKGSVSNMLASILIENKNKTGLFTSPHIIDFRERITVNGLQIPKEKVIEFCTKIQTIELDIAPSFFEITWALALEYFLEEKCEIVVVETGLGGRLDATNIINPEISVITSIGLDHTAILGNTLEEIAYEKAGIIKTNRPVVLGSIDPNIRSIFISKANECKSEIYFSEGFVNTNKFVYPKNTYQFQNEQTVRKTISIFNNQISTETIDKGIENVSKNTGLRCRFEIHSKAPLVVLDVAHNEDGIKEVVKSIQQIQKGNLHIIYGTSSDKNILKIISLFPKNATFYFTEFTNERTAKIEEIENFAKDLNLKYKAFFALEKAYFSAKEQTTDEDTILITGSFFLISDWFKMKQ
jgi:dihydrofolate synthase / folylpolyglutamate synthase